MNNQFRIIKHINNNKEILLSENNSDVVFVFLNQILSKETNISTMYDCQQNDNYYSLIHWKMNDYVYTLESIDDKLPIGYLTYLPYMLFNEGVLKVADIEYLQKIIELEPKYLCDLFVQKCMTDPFILLVDVFGLNEELIYQVFVYYLNRTVDVVDEVHKMDLIMVVEMFFVNSLDRDNINKYSKLFLKYLKMKQLMPFMIAYKKYEVIFNI